MVEVVVFHKEKVLRSRV